MVLYINAYTLAYGGKGIMKADELNIQLREIQASGWHEARARSLKAIAHEFLDPAMSKHPSACILAQKLDKLIDPYIGTSQSPDAQKLELILHTMSKLLEVINISSISHDFHHREENTAGRHTLILALKDQELAEDIAQQVRYFNYQSIDCLSLQAIYEAIENEPSNRISAIILDTALCENQELARLAEIAQKTPILFISEKDDIETRLLAVKAGGEAFFVTPIEFATLLETIDQVVTPPSEELPYRILIVEDSKTQASIIQKHIEEAGMVAKMMVDPLKIMEIMTDFQPDLILLDLYMPQCSGVELAKVIRQQDPYVGIPIVFLSAEDDQDKQLLAISGGGDDFLTKPISPHHLIAAVMARANRSRKLRSEMSQDSLTGLLNHTRILEQLDLEIARSKRNKTPLSFCMIDIDLFKTINDSHGHPVGDRVIKGLARLLKQRLRKIDSIGRYGGEEFAIIFPQTDATAVFKKVDEIRRGFSRLVHRSSDPLIEFSATFSVGLAQLSAEINTIDKLVTAADKALYLAKEQGRNRVVVYQKPD